MYMYRLIIIETNARINECKSKSTMFIYVCVNMRVIYVYMFVYMYASIYMYICMYIMYIFRHIYIHIYIYVYIHICIYIHIYKCMDVNLCIHLMCKNVGGMCNVEANVQEPVIANNHEIYKSIFVRIHVYIYICMYIQVNVYLYRCSYTSR
jgi:hypothetical protein